MEVFAERKKTRLKLRPTKQIAKNLPVLLKPPPVSALPRLGSVFFASRAGPMKAMKKVAGQTSIDTPPRQSALGQDLKAGSRSSHTLYTAPKDRRLCRQSESKRR